MATPLLKPRKAGKSEVLPSFAYILMGGWLGFAYLTPMAEPSLTKLGQIGWAFAPGVSILVGAVAGLILGKLCNIVLGYAFGRFNAGFQLATNLYTRMIRGFLRVSLIVLLVYGGLLGLTYFAFNKTPSGFIPAQDKGYLLVNVQLPDSTSVEHTRAVMAKVEQLAADSPGVEHTLALAGQSLLLNANAPNFGAMYVMLDEFEKRKDPDHYYPAYLLKHIEATFPEDASRIRAVYRAKFPVVGNIENNPIEREKLEACALDYAQKNMKDQELQAHAAFQKALPAVDSGSIAARLDSLLQDEIKDGLIKVFGAPPVDGLGTAGGFKIIIEDRGDLGLNSLQEVADSIAAKYIDLDTAGAASTTSSTAATDAGNGPTVSIRVALDPKARPASAALGKFPELAGLFTSFRANTPWLIA